MRALLTLLLMSAVAAASAARPKPHASSCPPLECHPSGPSFDYFKLVRQWPAGYCSSHDCPTQPPAGTSFTLHGLWPERNRPISGRRWPECCDSDFEFSEDNIQDLVPQLCRFWPSWSGPQDEKCAGMPPGQHSECFWKHEWDKHGTCSAVNAATAAAARNAGQYLEPHEYFEQVLQLHQQYDIEQALSAARIVPSDSDTYDSGDILGALQNAFGKKAYIECQRGLLTEVTTCLDKNLEIIDCRQSSDSCDSVSIPTDVPSDGFYQEYYMKGDELPAGVAAN
eukprot:GHUV01001046.1.p1 GENE.GHUV01001046.1~~GHUV01001046.1.p1  ORF type:complete len:282 (+),score=50.45 GHUV01001046.1:603-1448(+)